MGQASGDGRIRASSIWWMLLWYLINPPITHEKTKVRTAQKLNLSPRHTRLRRQALFQFPVKLGATLLELNTPDINFIGGIRTVAYPKSHHGSNLKKREKKTTNKITPEMPRNWFSLNFVASENLTFLNITKVYFLLYFLFGQLRGLILRAYIKSGFHCGNCRLRHLLLELMHLFLVPHRNLSWPLFSKIWRVYQAYENITVLVTLENSFPKPNETVLANL